MKEKNNKAVVITVVAFVIVAAVILGIMFLLPKLSDGGGTTQNEMHPEITGMRQAEDDEGFAKNSIPINLVIDS